MELKKIILVIICSIISILAVVVVSINLLISFLFGNTYRNLNISEQDIQKQIAIEKTKLENFNAGFEYLEKYKKKHGTYPITIDAKNLNFNSNDFEKFEYYTSENYDNYFITVYPNQGPIEKYRASNKPYYEEEYGKIDGVVDDTFYYKVDDHWYAEHNRFLTRYKK